jgi:hypothetical protein
MRRPADRPGVGREQPRSRHRLTARPERSARPPFPRQRRGPAWRGRSCRSPCAEPQAAPAAPGQAPRQRQRRAPSALPPLRSRFGRNPVPLGGEQGLSLPAQRHVPLVQPADAVESLDELRHTRLDHRREIGRDNDRVRRRRQERPGDRGLFKQPLRSCQTGEHRGAVAPAEQARKRGEGCGDDGHSRDPLDLRRAARNRSERRAEPRGRCRFGEAEKVGQFSRCCPPDHVA